jgi:hypothetical protein
LTQKNGDFSVGFGIFQQQRRGSTKQFLGGDDRDIHQQKWAYQ